jgi:hypothetical protein
VKAAAAARGRGLRSTVWVVAVAMAVALILAPRRAWAQSAGSVNQFYGAFGVPVHEILG